jgi:hypothetical protein
MTNPKFKRYYYSHQEKRCESANNYYRKWRNSLLDRLGGKCEHCGIADRRVLQIDHRLGNGKQERLAFASYSYFQRFLHSLSDEELHARYQILCANCNWIKRSENGECIGKRKLKHIVV